MSKKITVYSAPQCMQCKLTQRALDEQGIDYDVVDLSENPDALDYVKNGLGFSQAPVVETPSDSWAGFQPGRIKDLGPTQPTL
ncbi:MAG: glutaredoxin-like protein NrdH [Leucobacter sp.]